jgi:hypothetical protein
MDDEAVAGAGPAPPTLEESISSARAHALAAAIGPSLLHTPLAAAAPLPLPCGLDVDHLHPTSAARGGRPGSSRGHHNTKSVDGDDLEAGFVHSAHAAAPWMTDALSLETAAIRDSPPVGGVAGGGEGYSQFVSLSSRPPSAVGGAVAVDPPLPTNPNAPAHGHGDVDRVPVMMTPQYLRARSRVTPIPVYAARRMYDECIKRTARYPAARR